MTNFINRINALQAQLQDLLAGMTSRDRALFLGLLVCFVIGIVGGSISFMNSQLSSMKSSIETRENTLNIIRVNIAKYEAAQEQEETLQADLQRAASTDLSAFLDKCASEVNIEDKVDRINSTSKKTLPNFPAQLAE